MPSITDMSDADFSALLGLPSKTPGKPTATLIDQLAALTAKGPAGLTIKAGANGVAGKLAQGAGNVGKGHADIVDGQLRTGRALGKDD